MKWKDLGTKAKDSLERMKMFTSTKGHCWIPSFSWDLLLVTKMWIQIHQLHSFKLFTFLSFVTVCLKHHRLMHRQGSQLKVTVERRLYEGLSLANQRKFGSDSCWQSEAYHPVNPSGSPPITCCVKQCRRLLPFFWGGGGLVLFLLPELLNIFLHGFAAMPYPFLPYFPPAILLNFCGHSFFRTMPVREGGKCFDRLKRGKVGRRSPAESSLSSELFSLLFTEMSYNSIQTTFHFIFH